MSNPGRSLSALIIGSSQGMWRASLHTDGLNVYELGLLLGLALQDALQTLGNTNWLPIVVTKMWDIGWMLLKTSTGGNLIRATSSTSAGFECKLNFVYIFCNLFTFHFFFTPVPNGARHFLAYRLDSTRLPFSHLHPM